MINFTRAFDSAWERMMIILFRPFDLGKWCVIGFSAFLAGLLSGGNGFNTSYRQNLSQDWNHTNSHTGIVPSHGGLFAHLGGAFPPMLDFGLPLQPVSSGVTSFLAGYQSGVLILFACVGFLVAMALVVLIYWLGSRGQFLFLDNIVRNRPAIAWPWSFYARPANRVFVIYLIFIAVSVGIALVLIVPGVIIYYPYFLHPHWPEGAALAGLWALGIAYFLILMAAGIVMFLFREWGIPLMFRNGITAWAAFGEALGLLQRHPGPTILFVLLRVALWVALVVLSILACCFTCCLAMLPYVGTVVLLPALIYIRCFSLDCLAQFGPAYDVWTVDVPPPDTMSSAPFNPPPRLG